MLKVMCMDMRMDVCLDKNALVSIALLGVVYCSFASFLLTQSES